MGEYRAHVIALVEIARPARGADGRWLFDRAVLDASTAELQQLLATLQASGELRADVDPAVLSLAIRAAVDTAAAQLARDPGLDVEHYGRELAALFDRATHATHATQAPDRTT
jgi:hypothetical protein